MTTLYLFGSAAPPVLEIARVIENAQARGWDVCLGLTPTTARWLDDQLPELERLTGHPVRSEYKLPTESDVWPKADVILLAPATFNTINEWSLGLTSKFVVGVVAEAIGKEIPTVAMPCVNSAYAQHPQLHWSVDALRSMGVTVLYGEGGFVPNQPGERRPEGYPWHLALDAVETIVRPSAYDPARGNRAD
ncbi:flavoprotein [Streptomyces sp. NPDC002917]|uniref:flavoprotein n=1 Tax=Streptomyces sp. NPDC002917 TaxID=3364671 RepID=UPI0036AC38CB